MLQSKCALYEEPIYVSLVMDEMKIREQIEWTGGSNGHWVGLVDVGNGINDWKVEKATQALAFMVVSLNGRWKVPVGYLFYKLTQKAELVKQCLNALQNTGVIVTNFTFDGAPVNITTVKVLGCDLDPLNLNTCIA